MECDQNGVVITTEMEVFQLTHSRGVRLFPGFALLNLFGFQLTHSRGVRRRVPFPGVRNVGFQLTHSRGVRLHVGKNELNQENFNSRTHVECDGDVQFLETGCEISTHALTWSATLNIVLKKDSPHSIWEVIAFYHQLS